jgi:hypothetical protein
MLASWRSLVLTIVALLVWAPCAGAQSDTTRALDKKTVEDVDRQIDRPKDESGPNTELWEDYQRYKSDQSADADRKTSGERVNFGADVTVLEGERIEGDVVAIGGDTIIHGEVVGDVVSIGGNVILHDGASVEGDAVAVGGQVDERGDVEVTGETVSIGFNVLPLMKRQEMDLPKLRFASFFGYMTFLIVSLLIGFIFYTVAPRRLDAISRRVESEPGQSFLVGLLCFVGSPFLLILSIVLLAITVIGILLLPVLVIAFALSIVGGFFAVALAVGRRAAHFRDGTELPAARSPYLYLLFGFVGLHALTILGKLVGLTGGLLGPLGTMLGVVGVFVLLFATILGFGALVTSRAGRQPARPVPGFPEPGAVPPPPPPPPPPGERAAPPLTAEDAEVGVAGDPEAPRAEDRPF